MTEFCAVYAIGRTWVHGSLLPAGSDSQRWCIASKPGIGADAKSAGAAGEVPGLVQCVSIQAPRAVPSSASVLTCTRAGANKAASVAVDGVVGERPFHHHWRQAAQAAHQPGGDLGAAERRQRGALRRRQIRQGHGAQRIQHLARTAPEGPALRLEARQGQQAALDDGLQARHGTVRGPVRSAWGVGDDGRCWFSLSLPPGLSAAVQLPGQPARELAAGQHRLVAAA